jgi:hypothetical protein
MKWIRPSYCSLLLLIAAALTLAPHPARAVSEVIDESKKDELKLKYDVSVTDYGNGRVGVTFTVIDEGKLGPLTSVDLELPGRDRDAQGGAAPELHLSLEMRKTDAGAKIAGKKTTFELTKELAGRAEIWLMARQIDGKQLAMGYIFSIPIARYMKNAQANVAPAPRSDRTNTAPATPAPPASEPKN